MHPTTTDEKPKGPRDYEDRDIRMSTILWFGLFTAAFTALTLMAIKLTYSAFSAREAGREGPPPRFAEERALPPAAQILLPDEPASWREQLARETDLITGYAWVDKQAGVLRIPVDRAIDLLAERGLPSRAPGTEAPSQETAVPGGTP